MENSKNKNLINSVGRFGGKTKKSKDNDGNGEYETEVRNNSHELITNINEYYMKILDQQQRFINCWAKRTTFLNNKIIFEIFLIKNNELYKYVKNYEKIDDLTKEMENEIILDSTFQEIKLTSDTNSLTTITINEINIIDESIKNIKLINNQIVNFNEKPNNFDFTLSLNIYKYLTIFEKLIDKPKPAINKSIITKINNLSLGLLLITSSFIGKNTQRIVWINSYDEQQYTWQHYYQEIFLNIENHGITFLDTVINAFVISAISNWSRDTIWNIIQNVICCRKNKKNDDFKIKQIPINVLIDYKNKYEALLYEENEENLKRNIPKLKQITNFAKKINEIKYWPESEFEYHSNFTKKIEQINTLSKEEADNKPIDDNKKKQVISSINEIINNLTKPKKSILEPLPWKKRMYFFLNDLLLELSTLLNAHPIMAGVMANNVEKNFTLSNWPKYIFNLNILYGTAFACYAMRPINYLFKSGLTKWGIPTNFCPKIISQWVEKQNKYAKFSIAIALFFTLAIITNIIKTEASLITKFSIAESYDEFNAKIRKGETWLFFLLTTASQMFAFSLATNYRLFNFEILFKKIKYFFQPDINLVEENLIKLENDNTNLLFAEEDSEINERSIINLEAFDTNIPSSSQVNMQSNGFNADLININHEQIINSYSLNNESKVTLHR